MLLYKKIMLRVGPYT